jgi:hypothetical protein
MGCEAIATHFFLGNLTVLGELGAIVDPPSGRHPRDRGGIRGRINSILMHNWHCILELG